MTRNLVPTPRTDRNGRTVIRHIRDDTTAATTRQLLPAAALPETPPSIRQVKRELFNFLDDNTRSGYPDSSDYTLLEQWLEVSTGDQLSELLTAIHTVRDSKNSSDPVLLREAEVIRAIMHDTLNNKAHMVHTHDMLRFRSSFSDARFDLPKSSLKIILGVYVGNRCDMHGKPLPERELPTPEGFSASLRYSFEMMIACLYHGHDKQAIPVTEIYLTAEGKGPSGRATYSIFPYRDQELAYLISENPDRVENLIDLSLANKTSEPDRLLALMDYDGHATLSSGAL